MFAAGDGDGLGDPRDGDAIGDTDVECIGDADADEFSLPGASAAAAILSCVGTALMIEEDATIVAAAVDGVSRTRVKLS